MDRINDASAINLSTGKFTSFIDFLKIGRKVYGNNFKIITQKSKPVGVFARAGSTYKQRKLGFKTRITLEEGIERGLKYYENKIF